MTKLDVATKYVEDFEDEEPQGEAEPLHVKVSLLLVKLRLLWADRRRIVPWTFGTTIITFGLMFLIPNEYQAVAILNPPDQNPMSGMTLMLGMKGIQASMGSAMGDVLGLKSPGQIYISQMQSRVVEDAIIRRFDLQKLYRTKNIEDTRKRLEGNTEFSEDKKSGVIAIGVIDKDRNRSAQMANAYAEELGKLSAGMEAQSGRLEREYFEAQLAKAKDDFNQANIELSKYSGQKGAFDPQDQGKALADAVGEIEGQLIATKAELKGLQQIYSESNPQIQQAKARIAELSRQLALLSAGSQELGGKAGDRGTNGDQSLTDPSLRKMWGIAPPYMKLYGEVKIQEAVVESLAEQYEFAKLREAYRVSDVQLMDPAQPPEKKYKPHRARTAVALGLLVFLFCCGRTLMKDLWQNLSSDDPWRQMIEPMLARRRAASTQSGVHEHV
ncbi:MAG: hypothetical protein WBX19_01960 [Terracidiphilus sp.]